MTLLHYEIYRYIFPQVLLPKRFCNTSRTLGDSPVCVYIKKYKPKEKKAQNLIKDIDKFFYKAIENFDKHTFILLNFD